MGSNKLRLGVYAGFMALATVGLLLPTDAAASIDMSTMITLAWFVLGMIAMLVEVLIPRTQPNQERKSRPSAAISSHTFKLFPQVIDSAVGVAVAANIISVLYHLNQADTYQRASINYAWQWLGFGAIYFLTRRLGKDLAFAQSLLRGAFCLSIFLAIFALFQYQFVFKADQERYRKLSEPEKQRQLIVAGVTDPTEGSRERMLYESRLFTGEPFATLSHPNSLAAVLAVAVSGLLSFTIGSWRNLRKRAIFFAQAALLFLPMLLAILLTDSKAAWLSMIVSIAAIFVLPLVLQWSQRGFASLPRIAGTIGLLLFIGHFLFVLGLIQAPNSGSLPGSFQVRLEYWEATGNLIRDHFFLGTSPGNFQDTFSQYKLPEASETIADPHNFLFELWGTSGILAFSGVLIAVTLTLLCGIQSAFASRNSKTTHEQTTNETSPQTTVGSFFQVDWSEYGLLIGAMFLAVGYAFFVAMTFQNGFALDETAVGLLGSSLAFGLISHWDWSRQQVIRALIAGLLTWCAVMLMTGGVNSYGLGACLWIGMGLLVSLVSHAEFVPSEPNSNRSKSTQSTPNVTRTRLVSFALAALFGILAWNCQHLAMLPSIAGVDYYDQLARSRVLGPEVTGDVLARWRTVDPYSSDAEFLTASAALEVYVSSKDKSFWESSREHILRASQLRPRSSSLHRNAAEAFLFAYRTTNNREELDLAINFMAKANQLSPNEAISHLEYAQMLTVAGRINESQKEADRAAELDSINHHKDRALQSLKIGPPFVMSEKVSAKQLLNEIRIVKQNQ